MRKLALLLNSLLLALMVFIWFKAYPIGSFLDLNTLGMVLILTIFTFFSLLNLIAIYKCNQIYKGRKNIHILAFVFTLITSYLIVTFWGTMIHSIIYSQEYLRLIGVVIVSVVPVLNILLIVKCK